MKIKGFWKITPVVVLALALSGLLGCGGGSSSVVIKPTPADPGAETPAPPTQTQYVGWYDLTHYTRPIAEHLDKARRTSNLMYMRVDRGEYLNLLPYAKAEGWPAVILMAKERDDEGSHHIENAAAARAIIDQGLNLLCIINVDEADLRAEEIRPGVNIVQFLNQEYDLLKNELIRIGIGHVKVASTTWALANAALPWRTLLGKHGVPKGDILVHDSWYSGYMTELHNVRHRFLEWADYMRAARGEQEIIHIIKAWSGAKTDPEVISPEWVLAQLKCITGFGTTEYDWTNPITGDVAHVILEPLPAKYQGNILMYKMDDVRSKDSDNAGGNRPDIINAVAGFCKEHGWTMK